MSRSRERSRKPKNRRLSKRYSGDRVLIVSEGTETEPNYLHALKEYFKLNKAAIEIVPSSGSAPQSVVRHAKGAIIDACRKGNPYAKVYCVIDKDSHPSYANALQTIKDYDPENKEHYGTVLCAIPSVPCFEYWILMHFSQSTRSFGTGGSSPCGQLISTALSTHIPHYQKADRLLSKELITTQLATARANSVITLCAANNAGTDDPSTKMHLLVDELEHLKAYSYFQDDRKGCPND
ncbi:MAG: RloB domain-containing protein [Epsilonproteobacteria bacterium]|nr:RloB domain-containing protein [Campylobacterota bacterium]